MASSPETGKEVSEPAAAKDGINEKDPATALGECLVSQYAFFVAGVAGGTAYSVYRKPKNGLGIMMVTGAAGGLVDLAFGWNKACQPQVEAWKRHQQQSEIEKEAERRKS